MDDGKVGLPLQDVLDALLGVLLCHGDGVAVNAAHLLPVEAEEGGGDEGVAAGGDPQHRDRLGRCGGGVLDLDALQVHQHAADGVDEGGACRRGKDALAGALKDGEAQLGFQFLDGDAQRWLRHIECSRRPADGILPVGLQNIAELLQIHRFSPLLLPDGGKRAVKAAIIL